MSQSQCDMILRHLIEEGPITPLEALQKYGCFRLGARIWDLKNAGHKIETEMIKLNGKTVARYRYAEDQPVLFSKKNNRGRN